MAKPILQGGGNQLERCARCCQEQDESGNEELMKTKAVQVERIAVTSSQPFDEVVKKLEARLGHPDMRAFGMGIASAKNEAELEKIVREAAGPSELMVFVRLDIGGVLQKELGARARKSYRYIVGNPLIMKEMVKHVADAASYAPVTILVDERPDGVHLSYDTMASYLAAYGNEEALKVARELDAKVVALLTKVAG
jgi:uncharacterized protein (DUF302 family)